jgi:hypothetical protein
VLTVEAPVPAIEGQRRIPIDKKWTQWQHWT